MSDKYNAGLITKKLPAHHNREFCFYGIIIFYREEGSKK